MRLIDYLRTNKIKIIKEGSFLLLSFFIPFALLLILFSSNNFALFSHTGNTILSFDMRSEYTSYMMYFKHLLQGKESYIYMNSKMLGGDFLSIYSFYLSSPFNFFIIFVGDKDIPLFFLWTSIIKMSFASLNFYLLTRFTSRFTYHKLVACLGYGLISYSFIYMTNYMWLDGVMILPLVILGLYFIKERKIMWLYPLAIAYSLITSWYIGFMICIFTFIYFLALFFSEFSLKNRVNYAFLIRFCLFSLLGGLISSVLWFTAFLHFDGTKAAITLPKNYFNSISMLLAGFLENNYTQENVITQNNSYISMFTGIVTLVYASTYFCNKSFKVKERIALGVVLFIYLFCSMNSILSALMHGGREPTWFPGRYSFIIGFLISFYASKSLDEADKLNPLFYLVPTLLGATSIILLVNIKHSTRLPYYSISYVSLILYFSSILIGAIYSSFNFYKFKNEKINKMKRLSFLLLASLIFIESYSLYRGSDTTIKTNVESGSLSPYERYLNDVSYIPTFNKIKEYDESAFYRMEATFNRPDNYNTIDNNPMFYGYNGLSHFSSCSKKDVDNFLLRLGFQYNNYFSKYNLGSTYSINSLLGIKYLVEDIENIYNIHPYFLDYDTFTELDISEGSISYYQNDYAVSLAYLSDKTPYSYIKDTEVIDDHYTYKLDKFEYQNALFRSIDNSISKDIFKPLDIIEIDTDIEYEEDIKGIRTYKNIKTGNTINISFITPSYMTDYPLYFSEMNYFDKASYYIDGKQYKVTTYWDKGITSIHKNGRLIHDLRIYFNEDINKVTLRPELYYEDLDVAKEYLSNIKNNELKIETINNRFSSRGYIGHLYLNNKVDKDLIFTLPNEKNMKVYIDDKKVETYTKTNIMTAVDISNLKEGYHKIEIQYQDKGFIVGFTLSLFGLLSLVPLIVFIPLLEDKYLLKEKVD